MPGIDTRVLINTNVVDNGTWIPVEGFNVPYSITLQGFAAGDECQVRVSNAANIPANAAHEIQYGAVITVDGKVEITAPFRWMKVRRSLQGGAPGQVSAILCAQMAR